MTNYRLIVRMVLVVAAAGSLRAEELPDWTLGPFVRPAGVNPVIVPNPASQFEDPITGQPVRWEKLHTFNPGAIVRDGRVYLFYRAEDDAGTMSVGGHTSRIGIAVSDDGLHFKRESAPVFFPADDEQKANEWSGGAGGCEDPRIVESEEGTYVMTYTQYNGRKAKLGVATSGDLRTWTKHGPAFAAASGGKYGDLSCKSGSIVTRPVGDRLIAAKVNGTYLMYWGEGRIYVATSTNLTEWQPVEDSSGNLVEVVGPRPGRFDSDLPEAGPPAILTEKGILLIYNGKNKDDPNLGPGAYSGGQALFSASDPTRLLARLDEPFFQPQLRFERIGQYAAGTTFLEGLVHFRHQWFLYYGCADSLVAVAIHDPDGKVVPEVIPEGSN